MTPAGHAQTRPEVSFAHSTWVRHRTRWADQYVDALAGLVGTNRGNYSPLALASVPDVRLYDRAHRT